MILVQTLKTSKQQRQVIKTISVTVANAESKSKGIMKINIQVPNFKLRIKSNTIPSALQEKFPLLQRNYPTNFSKNNYKDPKLNLRTTKFAISSRGPRLWSKLATKETKSLTYDKLLKNITRDLLLRMKNELAVLRKLTQRHI